MKGGWQFSRDLQKFFGNTQDGAPLLYKHYKKSDFAFCIGPEKGFSKKETALLEQKGYEGITLNKNILRTETAALTGLAILSHMHQ